MNRRAAVIFNPTSGRGRAGRLRGAVEPRLGSAFTWIATQRAGEAVELARQAACEHNMVVAMGGDGTVGDVVRGLHEAARRHNVDPTLGIIPLGTGNDTARNLNIPLDLAAACDILLGDSTRRIDLGIVNNVPFINNVGAGFDAQVMQTVNTSLRFLSGPPAFLLAIFKELPKFRPFMLTTVVDDGPRRKRQAMMVAVLNGQVFGAGIRAAPQARLDDGLLDVLIIKALPKWRLLPLINLVRRGRHEGHPAVEMFQAARLSVETDPPQLLNIDGDVRGPSPMGIHIQRQALKVLAP